MFIKFIGTWCVVILKTIYNDWYFFKRKQIIKKGWPTLTNHGTDGGEVSVKSCFTKASQVSYEIWIVLSYLVQVS